MQLKGYGFKNRTERKEKIKKEASVVILTTCLSAPGEIPEQD